MSQKRDYYEVLGVARDANASAIKTAFRKLALECHPDRNPSPDAEERFKEANAAYAVLSDPEKRAQYDRFGHAGLDGMDDPFRGGMRPDDLRDIFGGDIFDQLFGSFFRRSPIRHGRDIQTQLSIDLETVAHGGSHSVQFQRQQSCDACSGSGCKPGTSPIRCQTCNGMGQVRIGQGLFVFPQPCPDCGGLGYTIPNPCVTCSGSGTISVQATVSIPVPSGVASGQTLRLDGEGHAGHRGGQTGDLYVDISVAIHPFFERRGDDIICEVPISFPQAALGTTIEVPTLTGKAKVKVPAGTQSGKSLRLRGKGLPQVASRGVGDQLIRLQIETPTKLNEEQRALLEQFETITAGRSDHLSKQRSFLDKLKDLFG